MGNVQQFTGTGRDARRILRCPECDSSAFKIVKRGASEKPVVECAGCECEMNAVTVIV